MARSIWKYGIDEVETTVKVPRGGQVRYVATQGGDVHLWIEVDPSAPLEERLFRIVGTGWIIPDGAIYHGSVQSVSGLFVWHIYEGGI